MRRGVLVVAAVVAALAAGTLPGAEASGDSNVVVRGGTLPAGSKSQLNLVGCDSVFGRTPEAVAPMIGAVPSRPGNKRSLGFDPAGGNAIGSVSYVDQVAATTVAGMWVYADAGTTGVAYVGYQAPSDAGTSLMWIGRTSLSAPAGVWTPIDDVPSRGYVWTQYDMATQQPIGGEVGSSGIPAFVQAMGGDGAGFYMIGFGCDGNAFNTDDWRIGTTTSATAYDFEGYDVDVTESQDLVIAPGERAQLAARVSSPNGAALSGVQVVLEAKDDDGDWRKVRRVDGPAVALTERPTETTTYRWKVYSTSMVEGDESRPFTVTVKDPPDPTEEPTADPSDGPTDPPSGAPTGEPSAPATSEAPPRTPVEPPAETATPPADTPPAEPALEQTQPPTEPATEPVAPTSDPPAAEQSAPAGEGAEVPAG